MPTSDHTRVLVEHCDGVAIITFSDTQLIDAQILAEVERQLDLIDGFDLSRVVITLGEVEHMSTLFLASLAHFSQRVDAVGGRL